MPQELILGLIILAVVLLIIILMSGYVKAPPDTAYIISGIKKKPKVLIGRAGIKIPFLERKDTLLLKQISIDIKTGGFVPTKDFIGVDIDAVAKVKVDTSEEGILKAQRNFLNMREKDFIIALTDSLQGNLREIIGTIELRELNTDRKKFGDEVQEKAQVDMKSLGIQIISCNIQRIEDEQGLINALGQDNMSKIQKDASIAKANADRDVAVAQAEAAKEANDARVISDLAIAQRNNELDIKRSELKVQADIKRAEADAAYEIQKQEQAKVIETQAVNVQIAKAEREAELKQKEVLVRQQELSAQIERQADAEKYKAEKDAEAILIQRQRQAEAEKYEQEKAAEAQKARADAQRYAAEQEAAGITAKGVAEANAIKAKGLAEAEAMEKKAEAYRKYNGAAVIEMMVKILPEMAAEVAKPLASIDKVNIYGGGNGADGSGVSQISGNMPIVMKQVFDTMTEATGVDFTEIMRASTYDAKVTKNINVTGLDAKAPADVKAEAVQAVKEPVYVPAGDDAE
ncbi:MAG: flotillin family protein [Lachnospiraceae bacterium]|nr:flotillin family protein [Lachnospiraceae bacterium]